MVCNYNEMNNKKKQYNEQLIFSQDNIQEHKCLFQCYVKSFDVNINSHIQNKHFRE